MNNTLKLSYESITMTKIKDILNKIDQYGNYALDLLTKFIEIPTVVPPGEKYLDFVQFCEKIFKDLGVEVEIIEVPKEFLRKYIPDYVDYPRYILVARWGDGDKIIHFNGHYDVVPPGSGWYVTEPFKPKYVNGRVYGRGASDMKGGLVSIILMLKSLIESKVKLNGLIEISFVPDEEIGGQTGTGYLIQILKKKPNYVIVAEPSGLNNIWIGNKGLIWAYVEVFGKQVHASIPWFGINAFEEGIKLAHKLATEYRSKIESIVSKYDYEIPEGKKASIVLGGDVRSVGKINIVPGYFTFSIDRRVLPDEDFEIAKKDLVETIYKYAKELNLQVNVKIVQESKPVVISPDSVLVKLLKSSIYEVLGIEAKTTVCVGGLDTRYFQEIGIEAVTYGPGNPKAAHISDEYIEFESILEVAKVYTDLIMKLLSE